MAAYTNVELKESASEANRNTDSHIYHALESAECDRDLLQAAEEDPELSGGIDHPTYDKIELGRLASKPRAPADAKVFDIVAEDSMYDIIERSGNLGSSESRAMTKKEALIPMYSAAAQRKKSAKSDSSMVPRNDSVTDSEQEPGYSRLDTRLASLGRAKSQGSSARNRRKHLACILIAGFALAVITLICLAALFSEIAKLKHNNNQLKQRLAIIEEKFAGQESPSTSLNMSRQWLLNASIADDISNQLSIIPILQDEIRSHNVTYEELRIKTEELMRFHIFTLTNPAGSCAALPPSSPSGYYWVRASNDSAVRVYCDTTRLCGGVTGGWMRVADWDMTDSTQPCPSGLRLHNDGTNRTCRKVGNEGGCSPVVTINIPYSYSQVCGRIIAYQVGGTNAFAKTGEKRENATLNNNYVDGVSLTHGNLTQHIWTFAAGLDEVGPVRPSTQCPCNNNSTATPPPPFVGENYFCEAGVANFSRHSMPQIYTDDPLWDGEGCMPSNPCCSFNNPPWFYRQLPQPTTDAIEMRVCRDEWSGNEDVAISIVEIYAQ